MKDSESDIDDEAPSIDSELAEFDPNALPIYYRMIILKSKETEGKPRDRLFKFDCKNGKTTLS